MTREIPSLGLKWRIWSGEDARLAAVALRCSAARVNVGSKSETGPGQPFSLGILGIYVVPSLTGYKGTIYTIRRVDQRYAWLMKSRLFMSKRLPQRVCQTVHSKRDNWNQRWTEMDDLIAKDSDSSIYELELSIAWPIMGDHEQRSRNGSVLAFEWEILGNSG